MSGKKYVCKYCNKPLDEMVDAILVRVVSVPTGCSPTNQDKKGCPCITKKPCIWHFNGDKYDGHFHFTKGIFRKESYNHCSGVRLENIEPLKEKDKRKLVAHLL